MGGRKQVGTHTRGSCRGRISGLCTEPPGQGCSGQCGRLSLESLDVWKQLKTLQARTFINLNNNSPLTFRYSLMY